MKIKKNWISYICIVLLVLNAFFKFEILIDLSSAEQEHIFPIYLFEIIAIITFATIIMNYKNNCAKNKLANKLLVIVFLFSVYYIILFFLRILTGNNYSSSMLLFRLNFSAFTFVIFILLNANKMKVLGKVFRTLLLLLNSGYLFTSIQTKYIAPHFPDSASTYFTVILISIPLCFLFVEEDRNSTMWRIVDTINLLIMNIFGCFSGSRAVFAIWIVEIFTLLFLTIKKKQKKWGFIFANSFLLLIVLYIFNFNFCQGSINRVLKFTSYTLNIEHPLDENIIENNNNEDIVKNDIVLDDVIKDVNYHNPVKASNQIRETLIGQALKLLKGDWIFSLQGNTELTFWQGEEQIVSGAHNAFLDYTLAFGIFGVIIISGFYSILILSIIKKMRKNNTEFTIFVLILLAMLGMGMTQAIFSLKLSLILFCTYMAFFYIKEDKENQNETSIIKKGNHIHG